MQISLKCECCNRVYTVSFTQTDEHEDWPDDTEMSGQFDDEAEDALFCPFCGEHGTVSADDLDDSE